LGFEFFVCSFFFSFEIFWLSLIQRRIVFVYLQWVVEGVVLEGMPNGGFCVPPTLPRCDAAGCFARREGKQRFLEFSRGVVFFELFFSFEYRAAGHHEYHFTVVH